MYRVLLLLLAAWSGFASASGSSQLQISPLSLELTEDRAVGAFALVNRGSQDRAIHGQAYRWRQDGDSDVLEPAEALLVSPPIFDLPAGARQVVRVGLVSPQAETREQAWRVMFTELPAESGDPLRISLRLSLPVFLEPNEDPGGPADVIWQLASDQTGAVSLTAANPGNQRQRYASVALENDKGNSLSVLPTAPIYLLAGATRSWKLSLPSETTRAGLRVVTTAGGKETRHELMSR